MIEIISAIVVYIFAFFSHSLLHQILKKKNTPSLLVILIYLLYLLILVSCLYYEEKSPLYFHVSSIHLPLTSLILYLLLSLLTSILYFPYLLKGQVPAARILAAFDKNHTMTEKQITSLFSESLLITQRVESLKEAKIIRKVNGKLFLTQRGILSYGFLHITTFLLGLSPGG